MDIKVNITTPGTFLGIQCPAYGISIPDSMAYLISRMGAVVVRVADQPAPAAPAPKPEAKAGAPKEASAAPLKPQPKASKAKAKAKRSLQYDSNGCLLTRHSPECQVDAAIARMTDYTKDEILAMPTGKCVNIAAARGVSIPSHSGKKNLIVAILRSNPSAKAKPNN
jgi:hypothetical protein